jgi:hypothetical protein
MSNSKRSICYHVLPEIESQKFSRADLLEMIKLHWPSGRKVTLVMDSFFGSLLTPNSLPNPYYSTFAIGHTYHNAFIELLSYNLNYKEFRVFKKDNTIISLWSDNKVMITGSTFFVSKKDPNAGIKINILDLPPRFSSEDAKILTQLSLEGIQKIAEAFGESSCCFFFLCLKI